MLPYYDYYRIIPRVNIEVERGERWIRKSIQKSNNKRCEQAHNKEHKRLNKKKMSLFKGENDTTKNSDNMLTMNQKNIPAVRFLMFTFFPAAHFCYISIFYLFFFAKKLPTMEMCPSPENIFFISCVNADIAFCLSISFRNCNVIVSSSGDVHVSTTMFA